VMDGEGEVSVEVGDVGEMGEQCGIPKSYYQKQPTEKGLRQRNLRYTLCSI
jgi:hypothetical protein